VTSNDEDQPVQQFLVKDRVRVWWATEEPAAWFEGEVDKVTAKTVDVYYPQEDQVTTHRVAKWVIQKVPNIIDESDDDS
jgi:hypothetical protein